MTSCVGCGSTSRKLSSPGPRCATCHRLTKKRRAQTAHARRIEATYGITADDYWSIYEAQGRMCAICQRAKGLKRKLSVDHDHSLVGPEAVRGLLCSFCNTMLGRGGDDPMFFIRAAMYLNAPPARKVLA